MDPLSIIASSIAIAGAVSSTLEAVRTLHNAGRELHPLMNEVSEIRIVFIEVQRAISERQHHQQLPQATVDNICLILEGAKKTLNELDAIIKERLVRTTAPLSEVKVVRLAWLRQRSKVKRFQQELRQSRLSLGNICGAAHLSDMSRIQLKLNELTIINEKQEHELSKHGSYLERISDQFTQSWHLNNTLSTIETSEEASIEFQRNPRTEDETSNHDPDFIIARRMIIEQDWSSSGNTSTLRARASHYRRTPCIGWCSCICHRPHYLQSPQMMDVLLGSLFIGYSGFPVRSPQCNETNCRQQSIPTIRVSYYFPHWFLTRVIKFVVSLSYMNGPMMSLAVPRVIPDDSPLLSFAVQGNLEGIKSLFSQGAASPYDVGLSNGRTALHYAVNYNHRELSQFLIETGADASLEDKDHTSSVAIAWERIFGRYSNVSTTTNSWRVMFRDEDYLESRVFPPLHKTILRLAGAGNDLRLQLQISTSTINDRDAEGLTALHWAAARGEVEAVQALLEFGAAPNVRSRRGHCPLSWAAQSFSQRRVEMVKMLLEHGAEVNRVDAYNRTPLLNAAADLDNPACMKLFVARGADVNWRDCHKRTPLGYAAKMGKCRNLEYLLSQGADPLIPDHWGHIPLSEAVQQNHHGVVRLLLKKDNIIPRAKLLSGMSILHLAATHGDTETLRLLAGGDVRNLDSEECNAEGLVAQALFDQRTHKDSELQEAFRALIESLHQDNESPGNSEASSDANEGVELFTDAVEFL